MWTTKSSTPNNPGSDEGLFNMYLRKNNTTIHAPRDHRPKSDERDIVVYEWKHKVGQGILLHLSDLGPLHVYRKRFVKKKRKT